MQAKGAGTVQVVDHAGVREFEFMGNVMSGLATPSRGAKQLEVWWGKAAPGAATPVHRHDAEEIVVVLRGRGEARADGAAMQFSAPCTLILPKEQLHQLANTGTETLEAIAVVPVGSKVFDADGNELPLPWRA